MLSYSINRPIEKWFMGVKRGWIWPQGQTEPKGIHHHRNTLLGALNTGGYNFTHMLNPICGSHHILHVGSDSRRNHTLLFYSLRFNGHFPGEPGLASCPLNSPSRFISGLRICSTDLLSMSFLTQSHSSEGLFQASSLSNSFNFPRYKTFDPVIIIFSICHPWLPINVV